MCDVLFFGSAPQHASSVSTSSPAIRRGNIGITFPFAFEARGGGRKSGATLGPQTRCGL
jgi:hypothetical protein